MPEFSPEIVDEICRRMANGESLLVICRDPRMPSRTCVYEWIADNRGGMADKYARARNMRADHYVDEIIEISDSVRGRGVTAEEVQAARLASDNRKWIAARMAPKNYGDKLETTNTTTLDVSDPIAALIMRVAESGKKVHDDSDR